MNRKFIITGAPGTGKTSIISELINMGISCSEEISREIIAEQIAIKGNALPWKNLKLFSKRVAKLRKKQFENTPNDQLHFFDRSIVDVIAYLNMHDLASKEIQQMEKQTNYQTTAFYTPIWKDIYINDNERKEDFKTAVNIENHILYTYHDLGYKLIEIPKIAIRDRANFILSKT